MDRRRRRLITLPLLTLAACTSLAWALYAPAPREIGPFGVFSVQPYLQPGDHPTLPNPGETDSFALLWQTADNENPADWEIKVRAGDAWTKSRPPIVSRLAVEGLPAYRLFRGTLDGLKPGERFSYRVIRKGKVEFESSVTARKPAGQPQKFVVFGDSGSGTSDQLPLAHQMYREAPDYLVITGDIVYMRGRVSEYLSNHFPVYNNDKASSDTGAPLLRSTLSFAAAGNHDLIDRDLDRIPDGLAFYYYWDLPRNGPIKTPGAAHSATLKGSEARKDAFLEAAKPTYPVTSNYSYDYGDSHWTVLDANPYADWNSPVLRDWLEGDLASASGKPWRFVAFHQPGFSSSKAHFEDQRMRILAPIFEKAKVNIVFNGHVHNYQRSYPLKFVPEPVKDSDLVNGKFTLDKSFDGKARTKPDGVLYIVTGAGGASLYDPGQTGDPASWQEFTAKFISNIHSFTVVELNADRLDVRQVSDQGRELDRFSVTH